MSNLAGDVELKLPTNTFNTHNTDNVRHITAAERTAWNAKQNALSVGNVNQVRRGDHSVQNIADLHVATSNRMRPHRYESGDISWFNANDPGLRFYELIGNTVNGMPYNGAYWVALFEVGENNNMIISARVIGSNETWRRILSGGTWRPWFQIDGFSRVSIPAVGDLMSESWYMLMNSRACYVSIYARRNPYANFATNQHLGTLPAGRRPPTTRYFPCSFLSGASGNVVGAISVQADGIIRVHASHGGNYIVGGGVIDLV